MVLVEVEVWAKVYAAELEVEVKWMDDVFTENPVLSTGQYFMVKLAPLLHRRLKEVRLTDYILHLVSLDL